MKSRMKRKKWSEVEEQTLLTKYADLHNSGTLPKLRTREKKFKPIADHVNSLHHLHDPTTFPFKWSWRDVSIKVQNMRHQYLGVKQKIRVSDHEFNWEDGDNHWENFIKYKEVFGDVELEIKDNNNDNNNNNNNNNNGDFSSNVDELFRGNRGEDDLGLGFEMIDSDDFEEEEEDCDRMEDQGSSSIQGNKVKRRRIALLGAKVLELRDVLVKREEMRKERDFSREEFSILNQENRRKAETLIEKRVAMEEEMLEDRQLELEQLQARLSATEFDRQLWLERELDEERRWRIKMEEKREEEDMEWRERMLGLQLDHEKQIMQMHADACHNQMQIIGIMTRFMCQFFGPAPDALGGSLGGLHPQVLQNLQHSGPAGLGVNDKPGSNSPPQYI